MLDNIWNSIRFGRRSGCRNPLAKKQPFDPLSHPAIRRMSPRELADLPLGAMWPAACVDRRCRTAAAYGHFTSGGMDDRMASTLPPVFRPNTVPRS